MGLDKLTVRGYKSIKELEDFELRNLNILIGANGAGKSNLLSLFRLAKALVDQNLQAYVQKQGGPDALLFGGRKRTPQMDALFYFGDRGYWARLVPTADNRLIFEREETLLQHRMSQPHNLLGYPEAWILGSPNPESQIVSAALQSLQLYHFQDTSDTAAVKGLHPSNDNLRLKPDAANLAAFLARLHKEFPSEYKRIVETIRLAAPFFGDFVIRDPLPSIVELEWTQQGDPDTPYRAHVLSDGTLRFICLTALLLQPWHLQPDTILIDEPELGLHSYAINLLAEMLKQVAGTGFRQVIVSTQSVELLNSFAPEDVIVVGREEGASTFRRLSAEALTDWLEDYTLGELWKKNVLGGRPSK